MVKLWKFVKQQRFGSKNFAKKKEWPFIPSGKSKNPGIVNIEKIAEGLGVTIREFYDSEIFDNLDPED